MDWEGEQHDRSIRQSLARGQRRMGDSRGSHTAGGIGMDRTGITIEIATAILLLLTGLLLEAYMTVG